MFKMWEGLGLLLKDNEDMRRTLDERIALWKNKTEDEVSSETELLGHAKSAWLLVSVIGWNAIALTGLGFVANKLWENDYHLTLFRLFAVVGSWATILFIVWLVASIFDKHAGFERWQKAFASREPLGMESEAQMARIVELAHAYPSIRQYKEEVLKHRKLRHEDIVIMEEMGRQIKNEEHLTQLVSL